MSNNTVETIDINPTLRVRIEIDTDAESPASWDNVGQITYRNTSRNVLGTEPVDGEQFRDIGVGILEGRLIGLPVYAMVHGGSSISTTAYNCPWDSGRSGWVYCTREKAIAEFGRKILSAAVKERTLNCLRGEVETFNQYLAGEVYGYIVERAEIGGWEQLDSCWGYYGLEYATEAAQSAATYYAEGVEA